LLDCIRKLTNWTANS